MHGLVACSNGAGGRFVQLLPPASSRRKQSDRYFHRRRNVSSPRCLAGRDGAGGPPELDHWDKMELKFGRLLGEDPKLTLAKIMGRKANPDVSYLEIEKSFREKKGEIAYGEVITRDSLGGNVVAGGKNPLSSTRLEAPRRPESAVDEKKLSLMRPTVDKRMKAAKAGEKPIAASLTPPSKATDGAHTKDGTPNVTLRKPAPLQGLDDLELEKPSNLRIKPNLVLKMRKGPVENLKDVSLLRKPVVMKISMDNPNHEGVPSGDFVGLSLKEMTSGNDAAVIGPSVMPTASVSINNNGVESPHDSVHGSDGSAVKGVMNAGNADIGLPSKLLETESPEGDSGTQIGLQPPEAKGVGPDVEQAPLLFASGSNSVLNHETACAHAALHEKPKRLDGPVEEISHPIEADGVNLIDKDHDIAAVVEHFASAEQEEYEVGDWRRAEDLLQTGERTEVEIISCSSSGFVVSFGSLIGFLPYRNLGAKWKFLAFESWLRKKGLDPSLYRQNLSIMGSYEVQKKNLMEFSEYLVDGPTEKLASNMKFEDLLHMYDQEKNKFLSSFIGQRIRVSVVFTDQKARKVMFSGRPKEKEELVERKRSVMARLSVGDVVKCCIKKITYFGIFVEVEGVPALIHQSEISWDGKLDPASFFKIGQIVDAKVHQLDYTLERITLSLKEIMPDPLNEALESVVGDLSSLDGRLETAQEDAEWADVESLIEELQQVDGVLGVSKGRFFLSPGLAPTFQVYMASMYENQYKLLARYGTMVQEVLVQSSLDKEQMKAAILTCTNRVE